jgi:hypothetical protein
MNVMEGKGREAATGGKSGGNCPPEGGTMTDAVSILLQQVINKNVDQIREYR